jgi:hypothetical protein
MDRAVNSRDRLDPRRRNLAREILTCKVWGARFSVTEGNEFCPVCMLRASLAEMLGGPNWPTLRTKQSLAKW